jgi:hypothetical protein
MDALVDCITEMDSCARRKRRRSECDEREREQNRVGIELVERERATDTLA